MKFVFNIVSTILILILWDDCFVLAQKNVVQVNYDMTNAALSIPSGNYELPACKEIHLLPGFRFAAQTTTSTPPTTSFRAFINPYMNCDVDYVTPFSFSSTNPPTINTSYEVGTTPGNFAVTQSGGATYTIPIEVPPGTVGMVPNLSITYSSQSGDGLLGMGWNLSGLSSITRAGQNLYYDQNITSITLSSSDRFVLDGARLFAAWNGIYGDEGTVYGTEVESFRNITSHCSGSVCPGYFIADAKDGSTIEYGNTSDSRIEASGGSSAVLTWLINKVTDIQNNYLQIHYTENNGNGSFRPDYIEYTGNTAQGLIPYNIVKFVYGTRQDKQEYFVAGHTVQQNDLLTSIEIYAQGTLVHKYEFNYSYSMGSHLAEVIEKGTDAQQFNSTKFVYETNYNYNPQSSSFNMPATIGKFYAIDFNGDGFSDIVRVTDAFTTGSDAWYAYANDGSGNFTQVSTGSLPNTYTGVIEKEGRHNISADFDGDGQEDLLLYSGAVISDLGYTVSNPRFKLLSSANSTSLVDANQDLIFTGNSKFILGDFDGDGATDLFLYFYDDSYNKGYFYSFKNKIGKYVLNSDLGDQGLNFYTTDLNGDGKQEVFVAYVNPFGNTCGSSGLTYYSLAFEYDGNDFVNISGCMGYPNGYQRIYPGDFNGDGKTDILTYAASGWLIGYSTGDGHNFITASAGLQNLGDPIDPSTNHGYAVADFNEDGKADILDKGLTNYGAPTYFEVRYGLGTDPNNYTVGYSNSGIAMAAEMFGDFDGDGHIELVVRDINNTSNFYVIKFLPGKDIHKIQQIINGLGHTTHLEYNTLPLLAKQNHYTKGTGASFPVIDFQKAMTVVSKVQPDDGIGGMNTIEYAYNGAKIHLQGKGFLGFTKFTSTNINSGITSENTYETSMAWLQSNFFQPVLTKSKSYLTSSGQGINEKTILTTDYTFKTGSNLPSSDFSGMRYNFYANHIYDNDQLHGITTDINILQDNFGNVQTQTSVNSAETVTLTNSYQKHCSIIANKLITSQTVKTRTLTSEPPYSRIVGFSYNGPGCSLSDKSEDVGVGVNTQYLNNQFGLPETTIVSGTGIPTSTMLNEYDLQKRFIEQETQKQSSGIDLVTQMTHENAYGNILTHIDANNLITKYAYDGFGRLKETTSPMNQKTTVVHTWEINTIPNSNSVYAITTSQIGEPTIKEYYDVLGRILRTETSGFDGTIISVDKFYNNLGQLVSETEPNNSFLLTTYSYESDFKRLQEVNTAGGRKIDYSYTYGQNKTKIETTVTTSSGQSVRTVNKTLDASGALLTSQDEGGTISYFYHSSGKPRQITTPGGAVTTMTYDNFGRQQTLNDPNAGIMQYEYDVLGELKKQTDAQGNIYQMSYDELSRVKSKTGPEGTVTYSYDIKPNGKGMIAGVNGFNGINCEYAYDNQSRLVSKTEQNIDGNNFAFNYLYDNQNRVTQIIYPTGFLVNRIYNNYGYLEKINDATNNLIWQCKTMTERLQVKTAEQGNQGLIGKGYDYFGSLIGIVRQEKNGGSSPVPVMNLDFPINTTTGNLDWRGDIIKSIHEDFTYDKLDRLLDISSNFNPSVGTSYYASGNIGFKSDVGNYNYSYLPHAISSIDDPTTELTGLNQQDIIYTAFHKADKITENTHELKFTYGYDYQRKISELKNSGNPVRKIIYVGDYEEITTNNGTYKVHYISSPDGLVAINVRQNNQDALYYVHTDHLGSILALYDKDGKKVYEQNFDAWGRERNPNYWTYTPNPNPKPEWLIRGFTGHEHHAEFGLINMNGRMYDPIVGRMLSSDNFVQIANYTQTYNRYTYSLNNPLKYTDPSGQFVGASLWGLSFIGGGLSNWINGYSDPFGRSFNEANNLVSNVGQVGQFKIYEGNGTTVKAGIDPFIFGVSFNVQHTSGGVTVGTGGGIGLLGTYVRGNAGYTSRDFSFSVNSGFGRGFQWTKEGNAYYTPYTLRYGGGITVGHFSFGLTHYGGKDAQFTWNGGYRNGLFSVSTENDAFLNFLNGRSSDKYRTAALEFSFGNLRGGFSIYTNDPNVNGGGTNSNWVSRTIPGAHEQGTYTYGQRIFSSAYFGYNDGITVSRIGIDSPWIQDAIQNVWHQIIGSPYFKTDYETPASPYLFNGYYSPFSLY